MKRSHSYSVFFGLVLAVSACGKTPDGETVSAGAEPVNQAAAPLKAAQPVRVAPPVKAALPAQAPAVAAKGDADEPKCDHCDHCDGKEAAADDEDRVESIAVGTSPTRGSATAPVTVVVFSDFQCPFCSRAESTVKEIEAAYPGKIRVVFKNSPLPFHDHARLAAKATLAANEQGKFWEYHDALFAHQHDLDRASLERYAGDLGLDLRRFRAALDDARLDLAVEADITEAHRLEVQGTPTFFVNGRIVRGAQPLAAFRARVDQALAER
ncbi:MAG: thioredoxin domain-containing protein [Byssovorax sp.]